MYNFFVSDDSRQGDFYFISGGDYNHIVNVLRMKKGEEFLVSDGGASNLCCIEDISSDSVQVRIITENYKVSELPIEIYLFQGLPKSDKMELIIQKATELGAVEIIPTEMKRSVVKLDEKRKKNKAQRWQSIAESAAKQSKRNVIPNVSEVMSFSEAVKAAEGLDLVLVPYENEQGMESTKAALAEMKNSMKIGIFIGPEGGFERSEIEKLVSLGAKTVSLGERILRTETAAITALSMCMIWAEMNPGENAND